MIYRPFLGLTAFGNILFCLGVKEKGNEMGLKSVATLGLVLATTGSYSLAQEPAGLSVGDLMRSIIAPQTAAIWGAFEVKDNEWAALSDAAQQVATAGELTLTGAYGDSYKSAAQDPQWQAYAQQMIDAANAVLAAVDKRDEEALFNVGNDQLYPPCENCHKDFMPK